MAMVDQDGRVFGRVNLVDAAVVVLVAVVLALTVVGYRLLRVPTAPNIAAVVPSTLTAGPSLRITLKGDNLLPYLRAYLRRTGQPTSVMHDPRETTSIDSYTLANTARAPFLVESQNLAEIRLPDGLLPGVYDLILHNDVKVVAVREHAFTITPAPVEKKTAAEPEGIVRVSGAFTALSRDAAATLVKGARFPRGDEDPYGEIVSVEPATYDNARINLGAGGITVKMNNRWQVGAELRLRCTLTQFKCFLPNGVVVAPGANLSVDATGTPVSFAVSDLAPDVKERPVRATVTIRLAARPDVLALVREKDADVSPGGDRDDPAVVVSIGARSEVTGEVDVALWESTFRSQQRVAVAEAVVRMPLTATPTGWVYRSQAIKAGATLVFQTDRYIVRGFIEGVTLPGSTR